MKSVLRAIGLMGLLAVCQGRVKGAGDGFAGHPAGAALERVLSEPPARGFVATGVERGAYLKLMAADVGYFQKCQRADGAIIDPYAHHEVQYATPAFALAAATLVKEAGRKDLLEPATRAMTCALTALVTHKAADQHSDFYIPLLVHAFETLKGEVPAEVAQGWEGQFRGIVPEKTYRMDLRGMNWNIVSSCGELLRRKEGLVAADQMDAQWRYLEASLEGHVKDITPTGLIEDPHAPLAYDAFSRMWLEEMLADGAYDGKLAGALEKSLRDGALSALLLLSPSGEWASGGRSAMHQWTEAENLLIFEIEAQRWKAAGRADVAGAFKRAAHLAFESVQRWQRPTGELWIVKNRAEPEARLGYEAYSFHSQYNLLPMAMLAMAYGHADDSIAERPAPAETGGYVFDARDHFHKVAAAAGGYYVLIDTAADPHYNATGLQRVQRAGVAFSALSDSVAAERAYGPTGAPKGALTPGLAWRDSGLWESLADFSGEGPKTIAAATVHVSKETAGEVQLEIDYALAGAGEEGRHVVEQYTLTGDGVRCVTTLRGGRSAEAFRLEVPVLVSDGAADMPVEISGGAVRVIDHGSVTIFTAEPVQAERSWELLGQRLVNHNGYVQRAVIPVAEPAAGFRVTLQQK